MQKVERKNRENRQRKPLLWILLCAAVLVTGVTAGILLQNRATEETGQTHQHITGAITARDAEDLLSLTVTRRGQEPWTAVREEDGSLRLEPEDASEPNTWIVDDSIANRLVDAAVNLTYEDIFTDNRSDAVAAGTVEDLDTGKELLHPVHLLEIRRALLDRITVRNGNGTVRQEWTLQGKVSDRDAAENWLLTAPFVYPADYDAIKMGELCLASCVKFLHRNDECCKGHPGRPGETKLHVQILS